MRPVIFRDLSPKKLLKVLIKVSLVLEAVALQFDRLRIEWLHINFRGITADFGTHIEYVLSTRFKRLNQQVIYLQKAVGRYLEIKSAASNAWFQSSALIVGGLSLIVGILSIILAARTAGHSP